MSELINAKKATIPKTRKSSHVPSKTQADTLFTFMGELEYLYSSLETKLLSARYCEENIKYLKISNLKKIVFPMKCFCDINMHKLNDHLSWYGYYGLAFTKEWGMNQQIQPIHYLNDQSLLVKDFRKAFSKALQIDPTKQTKNEQNMKNYLLHQLMYFKPYSGKMKNRITNLSDEKCFMDESEWRYIPDVSKIDYEQVYYKEEILNNSEFLNELSNSMIGNPDVSLKFEYSDLKYIIIKTEKDFEILVDKINKMPKLSQQEKNILISKIIIWDVSGGDF